ncbi:hypothetical protein [Paenibacillus sp. J2TS4]|uniref:hypothetical protein n=1 Tax=Paenibacillus sp. J2TS4 TaxID=2807194 RepID=UPI001B20BA86|nr:hypothetical protein [Paenibacillus sp. J2TS4]GIP33664.1 hypothetical protein J2TS4_28740 [Paenibacillus sp. J2TS4]
MALQVKTFEDKEELNNFLRTLPEDTVHSINYNVVGEELHSENFMVVYKINYKESMHS